MNSSQPVRVLPADVYDALELSALAFGGIGADRLSEYTGEGKVPVCVYGHGLWLTDAESLCDLENPVENVIDHALGGPEESDTAVEAINQRRGKQRDSRVSFRAWCRELNVVRGD